MMQKIKLQREQLQKYEHVKALLRGLLLPRRRIWIFGRSWLLPRLHGRSFGLPKVQGRLPQRSRNRI